jgi:hypothetical protein
VGAIALASKPAKSKAKPVVKCGKRRKGVVTCTVRMPAKVKRVTVNAAGKRVAAKRFKAGRGTMKLRTKARRATFLGHGKSGRVLRRAVVKLR